MARPSKLPIETVQKWLSEHPGWIETNQILSKKYQLGSYSAHIAFVVAVGMAAEKKDHHPDMLVEWGAVTVSWTTHDASGLTVLDLEMAETCDILARK